MPSPTRRSRAVLMLVVGLLASLIVSIGTAPTAEAANTGKVRGNISGPQGAPNKVQMLWFTKDWTFINKRMFKGGGYSISLPPGTYHLQFVDQRAAYDTKKYAPTDVKVTVRTNSTTVKNVKMKKGATITGTVKNGNGKPAKNVTVKAANASEQSFSVTANTKGQFALGGLPQGSYSVFFYDAGKNWVTKKSSWVPGLKPGKSKNISVRMTEPAGSLTVDLYTGSGTVGGHPYVTAISNESGQFWTAKGSHGSVVFRGLREGRYKLVVPSSGVWFGKTGAVQNGVVKSNRMAFGSFRLTQRGAWVTGTVVDGVDSTRILSGATVRLYDKAGNVIDETTSSSAGTFTLNGAIPTQTGMTVVALPGPYTDFLGEEPNRCQYEGTEVTPISVSQGKETAIGMVGLPRKKVTNPRPQCAVPDEERASR